jgi:hypothetical protein
MTSVPCLQIVEVLCPALRGGSCPGAASPWADLSPADCFVSQLLDTMSKGMGLLTTFTGVTTGERRNCARRDGLLRAPLSPPLQRSLLGRHG